MNISQITGGPCAGKSTALSQLRDRLLGLGINDPPLFVENVLPIIPHPKELRGGQPGVILSHTLSFHRRDLHVCVVPENATLLFSNSGGFHDPWAHDVDKIRSLLKSGASTANDFAIVRVRRGELAPPLRAHAAQRSP